MHCATRTAVTKPPSEGSENSATSESYPPASTAYPTASALSIAPAPEPQEVVPEGTLRAKLNVSRARGVAPLVVHFDASESVGDPRPFHSLSYSFQFGDEGAGRFAHTGHDRNTATGPIAAHVFEKPGAYRVRLTVTNQDKKRHHIEVPITVDDPSGVFRSSTYCIANDTNFEGCPEGAERISGNRLSSIQPYARKPGRILLKRGDRFLADSSLEMDFQGEGILGAFGKCVSPDARGICKNAPEIQNETNGLTSMIVAGDKRIMDVMFTGKSGDNGQSALGLSGVGALVYRVRSTQHQSGVQSSFDRVDHDQLAVVDSDIGQATSNQLYIGAERLILLGNHFHDSGTSHVLRVWHAYRSVISENLIENATVSGPNGRHALKLHGFAEGGGGSETGILDGTTAQGGPLHRTEFVLISDNTFGASPPWPVSIGPQYSQVDERVSHVIFERNFFRTSGRVFKTAQPLDTPIHCTATSDITVRSNVFDATGAGEDFTALSVSRYGVSPPTVDNVHFIDNLVFRTDRKGRSLRMVHVCKDARGTRVANNVGFAPEYDQAGRITVEDEGVGTFTENNRYVTDLKLSEKDMWSSRWLAGHEDTAQLAQSR